MKSGKKKNKDKKIQVSLSSNFEPQDFSFHHNLQNCEGQWGIMHSTNVPYPMDGLGTVLLPVAPFIACPKCQAAYLIPGFLDLIEKFIACQLIVSAKILTPKEIRFLRLVFDLTQQAVVDSIDAESVAYYSKCETGKPGYALSADKQVRLKVFYATKLGINSANDYHKINLTSTRKDKDDTHSILDLRTKFPKEIVENLEHEFKASYRLQGLTPLQDLPSVKEA